MLTIMWIPVLIQFATLLLAAVVAAASRSYLAAMLLVMIGMIAAPRCCGLSFISVLAYGSGASGPSAAECRTGHGALQGDDGRP